MGANKYSIRCCGSVIFRWAGYALSDRTLVYHRGMGNNANIIIADESALFFHLHCESPRQVGARQLWSNPFDISAESSPMLEQFNASHPLYGGEPVSILVPNAEQRRQSRRIKARCCPEGLPAKSFYQLRDGLYLASPELVYARMANFVPDVRLIEIGMNLCGRYYVNLDTQKIDDRNNFLTTPERLAAFIEEASGLRGGIKALEALHWVLPNSGSPLETKMAIQFCSPLWRGGFALPFTHMNWDMKVGRLARVAEQSEYCIDLANPVLSEGLEYDGDDSHPNPSKDKRRRNALQAFGWSTFAIDKAVLLDPDATRKAGLQIAKHMGLRLQFPTRWERNFVALRTALNLPT